MKLYEHFLASSTGGILVALVATPFDVIKTRIIAQTLHTHDRSCFYKYCEGIMKDVCLSCGYAHTPQYVYRGLCQKEVYSGTLDTAFRIARSEGVFALWNGITPSLFMIVPAAVLYFSMFDLVKQRGKCYVHEKYHHFVPSFAGITARVINVGIFSPVQLIKTKAQSEYLLSSDKLKNIIIKHIKANGVRSLWYGTKSQLFRDVPFTLVYWYLQDAVRIKLSKMGYSTLLSNCGGAIVGGSVAGVISHPFDITKTQLQSNVGLNSDIGQKGLFDQLRNIARADGVRGLYVGLTPRILQIIPSCAIFITTFECLKEHFNKREENSNY